MHTVTPDELYPPFVTIRKSGEIMMSASLRNLLPAREILDFEIHIDHGKVIFEQKAGGRWTFQRRANGSLALRSYGLVTRVFPRYGIGPGRYEASKDGNELIIKI